MADLYENFAADYDWLFGDDVLARGEAIDLDQEHIAHIVFVFEDGDKAEPREYRIPFRPFTFGELSERLELAGLRQVDTDFGDARDRYAVVAVAA
jgi:hypothetical protein